MAATYQAAAGLSAKDAVHAACAISSEATHLLTCDDRFASGARRLDLRLLILNPVEYVLQGARQ
jgi:predicted nucleic acid-binding protein